MISVQAADARREDVGAAAALLATVFPGAPRLDAAWLAWSYLDNPLGSTVLGVAREDDRALAQIAGRPMRAHLGTATEPTQGVLIHHAATHPSHRRRGLLVGVVEAALAHAQASGSRFAIAVVNQNSVDAFVHKLGFAALGPLDVRLALGAPPTRRVADDALDFDPARDPAWLAWRLAPPNASYRTRRHDAALEVWADSGILGIPMLLGVVPLAAAPARAGSMARPLVHAWAGRDPAHGYGALRSVLVPRALRPSPLHLVFRSLAAQVRTPRPDAIRFDALDFDAW